MCYLSNTHAYHSLADTKRGIAAAVDPVDAAKVRATAANHGLTINLVLTTHAHKYAHTFYSGLVSDFKSTLFL